MNGRTKHVAKAVLEVLRCQAVLGETLAEMVAGDYDSTVVDLLFLTLQLDHLERAVDGAQMVVSYAHHQAQRDREREDEAAQLARMDEEWGPDPDVPWTGLKDDGVPADPPAAFPSTRS